MSDPASPLVPLALLSPGVKDARLEALTHVFGDALSKIDIASLLMSDPLTVDARLLPFMIREFSAQDYIDPAFPEHIQRRILNNIWDLQALKGFDAGVTLGLKLLGMTGVIEHWHQVEPKGPPNTHSITCYVGERIFDNEQAILNDRVQAAATRMIKATKRHSQETKMRIGAGFSGEITAANTMAASQLHREAFAADRNGSMRTEVGLTNAQAGCALHRQRITADRNSRLQSGVQFASSFASAQLGRFSCACAP